MNSFLLKFVANSEMPNQQLRNEAIHCFVTTYKTINIVSLNLCPALPEILHQFLLMLHQKHSKDSLSFL